MFHGLADFFEWTVLDPISWITGRQYDSTKLLIDWWWYTSTCVNYLQMWLNINLFTDVF